MHFKYFAYTCTCIACTVSDSIEFEIIFAFERCQCFQGIQVIIHLLFLDPTPVPMAGPPMGNSPYSAPQSGPPPSGAPPPYELAGPAPGGLPYDPNPSKYSICSRFNCFSFHLSSRQVTLCLSRILFETISNGRS